MTLLKNGLRLERVTKETSYKQKLALDTDQVRATSQPDTGPKVRLLTLESLDQRTHAARLARSLIEEIESDLGGVEHLSAGIRQIVKRAAVLGAYVENCEVRWLSGQAVDIAEYLMAVGVQRRLLVTIGLERRSRAVTPTLPPLNNTFNFAQRICLIYGLRRDFVKLWMNEKSCPLFVPREQRMVSQNPIAQSRSPRT
jgi:hypothetical protein